MGASRSFSIRSFVLIFVVMTLLAGGLAAAVTMGLGPLQQELRLLAAAASPSAEDIRRAADALDTYGTYLMAGGACLLVIVALVLWLIIRAVAAKPEAAGKPRGAPAPADKGRDDPQRAEREPCARPPTRRPWRRSRSRS